MKEYLTPEHIREKLNEKRRRIVAEGGAAYEGLLARERAARALYCQRHPDILKVQRQVWDKKRVRKQKTRGNIMRRKFNERMKDARKRGIEATIKFTDISWPTHCPVLGIELDYKTKRGNRKALNPANPSIDRWDNTKGYIPGNVFIISNRANSLKNNGSIEELEAVAKYARHGPVGCLPGGLF